MKKKSGFLIIKSLIFIMKKYIILSIFFFFVIFSAYTETYRQIENRFTLWYKNTVWEKLDETVSSAIDKFNNDKNFNNAEFVMIWVIARYAYWRTVRQTAEVLHEQLGDRYGQWKYSIIFEQASNEEKKYSEQCWNISKYFLENYPDWNFSAAENIGYFDYYGDFFRIARRL